MLPPSHGMLSFVLDKSTLIFLLKISLSSFSCVTSSFIRCNLGNVVPAVISSSANFLSKFCMKTFPHSACQSSDVSPFPATPAPTISLSAPNDQKSSPLFLEGFKAADRCMLRPSKSSSPATVPETTFYSPPTPFDLSRTPFVSPGQNFVTELGFPRGTVI